MTDFVELQNALGVLGALHKDCKLGVGGSGDLSVDAPSMGRGLARRLRRDGVTYTLEAVNKVVGGVLERVATTDGAHGLKQPVLRAAIRGVACLAATYSAEGATTAADRLTSHAKQLTWLVDKVFPGGEEPADASAPVTPPAPTQTAARAQAAALQAAAEAAAAEAEAAEAAAEQAAQEEQDELRRLSCVIDAAEVAAEGSGSGTEADGEAVAAAKVGPHACDVSSTCHGCGDAAPSMMTMSPPSPVTLPGPALGLMGAGSASPGGICNTAGPPLGKVRRRASATALSTMENASAAAGAVPFVAVVPPPYYTGVIARR
jgi:hypothetical protein